MLTSVLAVTGRTNSEGGPQYTAVGIAIAVFVALVFAAVLYQRLRRRK